MVMDIFNILFLVVILGIIYYQRQQVSTIPHDSVMNRRDWLLFAAVFALGASLRLYQLGALPAGLNQDEASLGTDAWSLITYGVDRNGYTLPILPMSWGSGSGGFYIYLLLPFVRLFGLSVFILRLPNALLHIASLVFFYDGMRRILGKHTAWWSLLLLSISPWHIMASRWALDANQIFALVLIGVYWISRGFQSKKFVHHALGMVFFSLSLYSYGVALMVVPLLLLATYGIWLYYRQIQWSTAIGSAVVLVVVSLPVLLFYAINYFDLPEIITPFFSIPRHTEMRQMQTLLTWDATFFENVWSNLKNAISMITFSNADYIWNTLPQYGIYYVFSFPFIIVGVAVLSNIYKVNQMKRLPWTLWGIVAFGVALVMHQNINRMAIVFIPIIMVVGVGLAAIVHSARRPIQTILLVMYALSISNFSYDYFGFYNTDISDDFSSGYGDAIEFAQNLDPTMLFLPSQSQVNGSYVTSLFYLQPNMRDYLETRVYSNPGSAFQYVSRFEADGVDYRYIDPVFLSNINEHHVYIYRIGFLNYVLDEEANYQTFDHFIVVYHESRDVES